MCIRDRLKGRRHEERFESWKKVRDGMQKLKMELVANQIEIESPSPYRRNGSPILNTSIIESEEEDESDIYSKKTKKKSKKKSDKHIEFPLKEQPNRAEQIQDHRIENHKHYVQGHHQRVKSLGMTPSNNTHHQHQHHHSTHFSNPKGQNVGSHHHHKKAEKDEEEEDDDDEWEYEYEYEDEDEEEEEEEHNHKVEHHKHNAAKHKDGKSHSNNGKNLLELLEQEEDHGHESMESEEESESDSESEEELDEDRLRIRRRLRVAMWAVSYIVFLFGYVRRKVANRRNIVSKELTVKIEQASIDSIQLISSTVQKVLNTIYTEKKSLCFIMNAEKGLLGGKVALEYEEIEARLEVIKKHLKSLVETLGEKISQETVPGTLIEYFALLTQVKGIVPQNFYFDFELRRMEFTIYATNKNYKPERTKMIIAFQILIRTLIYKFLLRPWEVNPKVKKGENFRRNMKTLASVLYHIILDHMKMSAPVIQKNQIHLPNFAKIKPKAEPLYAEETRVDRAETYTRKKNDDDNIIDGLYSKDQLEDLFENHRQWIAQMKGITEFLLEKIHDLIKKHMEKLQDQQDLSLIHI
eukprot:TRINITY_DN7217_c0_g1_i3.p1 TRINITY_DN7217_c0_g1~~TRINITY_DN7217_c0_g1_i3.p1  ORF type:complete len:604 (-),score=119.35 TRINITY_DN7217_c0_g1_i3:60-1802(-)